MSANGEDPRELRLYGKVRRRLAVGVFGLLAVDIVADIVLPFDPSPVVLLLLAGLLTALVGLEVLKLPESLWRK